MFSFYKKVVEENDSEKFERLIKEIENVKQKLHIARLKIKEKEENNDKK